MAKGEFDSPSKPATEAYKRNWERIWGYGEKSQGVTIPDRYHVEDCKRFWREHPNMPGYCTIDLNGSHMTPAIEVIGEEIKAEFGELHYKNGCPILPEDGQ